MRQAWPLVESVEFVDNWHIGAICEHLEAVTRGDIMKLLINIPPGCMKSLLVCVFWFSWEWATDPSTRWMFASYDQKLSTRDSLRSRALIKSPWYQRQWNVQLSHDDNQKTYFTSSAGGYRMATTPGGHGIGEHPDRIVVDDPHNVKRAESEPERQSVLDWWTMEMPTRGAGRNCRRVIIMQRLNMGDLSGHVLEQGGWDHLCLPMRYERDRMKTTSIGFDDPRTEEGELLWPKQYDDKKLEEIESDMAGKGAYVIAGQMQQRPTAREGGMFKSVWFETVPADSVPAAFDSMVRGWDLAATEGGGDWSVGVLMGKRGGELWILNVVRGQWGPGERDDRMELAAYADDMAYPRKVKTWYPQDPGAAGKQVAQILSARLSGGGFRNEYETVTGSKEDRADALASRCWEGAKRGDRVKVVQAAWTKAFIDELSTFPMGKDDQVDAATMAFNKLAKPGSKLLVA